MSETKLKQEPNQYIDMGQNLGKGKFGTVNLIKVDNEFRALKSIKKNSIIDSKRIEHIFNEK